MHLVNNCTPPATLNCHHELEEFIGRSLLGDWMIRIEHKGDNEPPYHRWQQWGDMLFAITRPDSVMEAIYACRSSYPAHAIRIYAEKVWPESRMIYRIHETPDSGQTRQHSESGGKALPAPATNQGWGNAWAARVGQSG
ncbi:MAG: ribulose bisphosphate carboxylase small subunit [Gammaproteobacteria bacterium]|jgi:ribulose bisphosphate carboxylase small subunit